MKKYLFFLFLSISYVAFSQQKEIYYADPTIYAEDGKYYLSGTKSGGTAGFALLVSEDLKNWSVAKETMAGNVLSKGYNTYGTSGFWAPQFYKIDNTYYLSYTADEQVCVAKSNKITGPYTQSTIEAVDISAKNIDSFVFKDDNGKYYLYHVRFSGGNFIYVAEFNPVTNKMKGTPTKCLSKTQNWENVPDDEYDGTIMEGPTVFKRNGVYYLLYSANHFKSPDYAVGYAVASSPLGPWTKYPNNPIISKSIVGENGTGHGDLFLDKNGKPYYVFHVHNSSTTVETRRTRIMGLKFTYSNILGYDEISADPSSLIVPIYDRDVIYVSPTGSGSGSGTSWANSTTLAEALLTAQSGGKYSQIWLKTGTYKLSSRINFDNIYIYGGFKGEENFLSERNWNLYPAILDGKGTTSVIRNTTGASRTGGDSQSVPCLLDGIIIQNGINPTAENGGGMLINNGATVKNCIFRNNETQNSKSGAALYCHFGSFVIENTLFINNTSTGNGGALQIGNNASVTLLNCTFANNKASDTGGAVGTETASSNVTFVNSIVHNNLDGSLNYNSYGQNGLVNGGGAILSIHSAIESACSKFGDAGNINHIALSRTLCPEFASPSGIIGKGTTTNEIDEINQASYQLTATSCCVDYGNDDKAKGILYDLAGKSRIYGSHVDLGAYEFMPASSIIPQKNTGKQTIQVASSGKNTYIYGLQTGNMLQIFSLQGVLIHSEKVKQNDNFHITLPSGVYLLQTGGQSLVFRN